MLIELRRTAEESRPRDDVSGRCLSLDERQQRGWISAVVRVTRSEATPFELSLSRNNLALM